MSATGGTAPYSWTIKLGSLPTGLILNPATGTISGTPSVYGAATFTLLVTDASAPKPLSVTRQFTLIIAPKPLNIATSSLPSGQLGKPYAATRISIGGVPPYAWSISSGAIPAGLALNASTGSVAGAPTVTGLAVFNATATDSTAPAPQTIHTPFAILVFSDTGRSVLFGWGPSSSPTATAYNIYRSNTTGTGYSKIDATAIAGSTYTDATVISGHTSYYVLTAVAMGRKRLFPRATRAHSVTCRSALTKAPTNALAMTTPLFCLLFLLLSPTLALSQSDPLSPSYLPAIDTNTADYPANIWITNSLQKVRQDSGAPETHHWGTFYGTQNEFVDFQIHVQAPAADYPSLTITVSDFVNSRTRTIISAASTSVIVYREAYVHVQGYPTNNRPDSAVPGGANYSAFYGGALGYYLDILIPAVDPYWHQITNAWPLNAAPGKNQSALGRRPDPRRRSSRLLSRDRHRHQWQYLPRGHARHHRRLAMAQLRPYALHAHHDR